ncbi:MAG: hypothetical protein PWQ53_1280 [Bacteroidota bacterium]|jgi:hypothetical protein|nr:hypothetical protein [Bacteroidota bacterium]
MQTVQLNNVVEMPVPGFDGFQLTDINNDKTV